MRLKLPMLLAALLIVASASAETIKLADGSTLKGRATNYDAQTQVLTFLTDAGESLELPLTQLNARSVYQVHHSLVAKDNGAGQLKLANFARDAGLYAHSARHYRQAAEADPALAAEVEAQLAIARQMAAQFCMDQARAAADKGDLGGAEKWLETLILKLPDEPQAAEAAQILERHYSEVRAARDDAVEAANVQLYEKGLASARKSYDAMVKQTQQGLTRKKVDSQSLSTWNRALKDGQSALKDLDRLGAAESDPQVLEQISVYRGIVIGQMVEIRLHAANYYAVRSSYNKALGEVNQALALDPENVQALGLRSRVVDASSRGLRWLW